MSVIAVIDCFTHDVTRFYFTCVLLKQNTVIISGVIVGKQVYFLWKCKLARFYFLALNDCHISHVGSKVAAP